MNVHAIRGLATITLIFTGAGFIGIAFVTLTANGVVLLAIAAWTTAWGVAPRSQRNHAMSFTTEDAREYLARTRAAVIAAEQALNDAIRRRDRAEEMLIEAEERGE